MADVKDLLLAKYREERDYARQHENQRASVTNVVIAIAAATLGFLGTGNGSQFHAAAAGLLIGLGVFGAILSRKHYERFRFHSTWAKQFDQKLREIEPGIDIHEYASKLDEHNERFGWIGQARLNWLWTGVHLLVTTIGIALLVIALCDFDVKRTGQPSTSDRSDDVRTTNAATGPRHVAQYEAAL